MVPRQETGAPVVDALEMLGLLTLPILVVGVGVSVVSGTENAVAGVVIGGLFGAILAGLRRGFYAVRTEDGIERRVRTAPEGSVWARLATIEYDETYDRPLSIGLLLVGITALAAIPFIDPQNGPLVLRLALVGLFGLTAGLLAHGVRRS